MTNETLKVLIIEDEERGRSALMTLLRNSGYQYVLVGAYSTIEEAIPMIEVNELDIIFLDIMLPRQSGFYLFEYFKDKELNAEVIITTADGDYALKAFDFSAIDYLLKPIKMVELKRALAKVTDRKLIQKNADQYMLLKENLDGEFKTLALPHSNGYHFLKMEDILYIEADGNYSSFKLKDGSSKVVIRKLGFYGDLLSDFSFFRCNRSFIVNMTAVQGVTKGRKMKAVMSNGDQISVSELLRDEFMQRVLGK